MQKKVFLLFETVQVVSKFFFPSFYFPNHFKVPVRFATITSYKVWIWFWHKWYTSDDGVILLFSPLSDSVIFCEMISPCWEVCT